MPACQPWLFVFADSIFHIQLLEPFRRRAERARGREAERGKRFGAHLLEVSFGGDAGADVRGVRRIEGEALSVDLEGSGSAAKATVVSKARERAFMALL